MKLNFYHYSNLKYLSYISILFLFRSASGLQKYKITTLKMQNKIKNIIRS